MHIHELTRLVIDALQPIRPDLRHRQSLSFNIHDKLKSRECNTIVETAIKRTKNRSV